MRVRCHRQGCRSQLQSSSHWGQSSLYRSPAPGSPQHTQGAPPPVTYKSQRLWTEPGIRDWTFVRLQCFLKRTPITITSIKLCFFSCYSLHQSNKRPYISCASGFFRSAHCQGPSRHHSAFCLTHRQRQQPHWWGSGQISLCFCFFPPHPCLCRPSKIPRDIHPSILSSLPLPVPLTAHRFWVSTVSFPAPVSEYNMPLSTTPSSSFS